MLDDFDILFQDMENCKDIFYFLLYTYIIFKLGERLQ